MGNAKLLEFFNSQIGPGNRFSSRAEAARFLGLPQTQATKFFNFLKGKKAEYPAVIEWLEKFGGRIDLPINQEFSRDVCFVDAKVVPVGEGQQPPESEDYLAVPLVAEVGAGPGIISEEGVKSWFLVWRHQRAIAGRTNLIAVEIEAHSTSMVPLLNPRDVVLVDLDDTDVISRSGKIMLVLDPDEGSMIKRVAAERIPEEKDYRLTFYSDNAVANPPRMFSLRKDFGNDIKKAVAGHVVWAWSDVSWK